MDILLIEADAHRRVALAYHLATARHCVTICSSVAEAREVLCFLNSEDGAPNAVVIGERLISADGDRFREEMADRFPDAFWIPLRADLSLDWLDDWLTKRDTWRKERSNVVRLPTRRGSSFQTGENAPPKSSVPAARKYDKCASTSSRCGSLSAKPGGPSDPPPPCCRSTWTCPCHS
jgi:hypothetical protein